MKNKKMELKVWADGIQRIVCGVNESTTCQDVVYALAHATGQTGRFTLVERWRSNERTLAPNEHPLKVLNKWGEYSNDVQFVLKRSALTPKGSTNLQQSTAIHREMDVAHSFSPPLSPRRTFSPTAMHIPSPAGKSHQTKEAIKKSLTFTGIHQSEAQMQDSDRRSETSQSNVKGFSQMVPSDDTREPIMADDNSSNFHNSNDHSVNAFFETERTKDDHVMTTDIKSASNLVISSPNHKSSDFVNKNTSFPVGENKRNLFPTEHPMTTSAGLHFTTNVNFHSLNPGSVLASDGHRQHMMSPKSSHHHHTHHNHHHHHHTTPPPPPPPLPPPTHSHSQGDLNRQLSPGSQHHSRIPARPPPYPGHSTSSPKIFTGAMSPPPYRSPPTDKIQRFSNKNPGSNQSTPTNPLTPKSNEGFSSPASQSNTSNTETPKSRRNLYSQFQTQNRDPEIENKELGTNGFTGPTQELKFQDKQDSSGKGANQEVTKVIYDSRYRDLVRLVNMQRDTLNGQHTQLTQFDAEITYWEEKQRERSRQSDVMEVELRKIEMRNHDADAEVAHLGQLHLEEDLELGHQQERTLRSELTLLRSKLANCETELLQCKNKIRILMDEASEERRLLNRKEDEDRDRERNILNEIETLQKEIRSKIQEYDLKISSSEKLSEEINEIETVIAKKKKEVEDLVHEMKEANLESLFIAPGDELKHLDGGANRPGSTRKIMGSPRELENAVPTSKNPHGVWV